MHAWLVQGAINSPVAPQELIYGQPGEEAAQHGMSAKQRQLMEAHLHPAGGQGPPARVHAEVRRWWQLGGSGGEHARRPSPRHALPSVYCRTRALGVRPTRPPASQLAPAAWTSQTLAAPRRRQGGRAAAPQMRARRSRRRPLPSAWSLARTARRQWMMPRRSSEQSGAPAWLQRPPLGMAEHRQWAPLWRCIYMEAVS